MTALSLSGSVWKFIGVEWECAGPDRWIFQVDKLRMYNIRKIRDIYYPELVDYGNGLSVQGVYGESAFYVLLSEGHYKYGMPSLGEAKKWCEDSHRHILTLIFSDVATINGSSLIIKNLSSDPCLEPKFLETWIKEAPGWIKATYTAFIEQSALTAGQYRSRKAENFKSKAEAEKFLKEEIRNIIQKLCETYLERG